jgi:hypothetical protein
VRGNPGVFLGNPHPHPQKPATSCRDRGFKGSGCGFTKTRGSNAGNGRFVIITLYYYDIMITTNNHKTNKTN